MNSLDFFPKIERAADTAAASKNPGTANAQSAKRAGGAGLPSFAEALSGRREPASPAKAPVESGKAKDGAPSRRPAAGAVDAARQGAIGSEPMSPVVPSGPAVKSEAPSERRAPDLADLEVAAADREQKAALKQRAVLEFMSEMRARFGIEPERIVTAFSQLDERTLNGRPEEAMAQFLAQLQIPPAQLEDAGALYQEMVHSTGESALNEKLGAGTKIVNLQILSPKERRTMELHGRLDAMTDKFFRRGELVGDGPKDPLAMMGFAGPEPVVVGPGALTPAEAGTGDLTPAGIESGESKTGSKDGDGFGSDVGAWVGAGFAAAGSTARALSAPSAAASTAGSGMGSAASVAAQQGAFAEEAADFGGTASDDGALDEFFDGSGAEPGTGGSAGLGSPAAGGFGAALAGAATVASSAPGIAASDAVMGDPENESVEIDVGTASAHAAAGSARASHAEAKPGASTPDGMILRQPQATLEQKQDNINEIIRQAQVIMKRGGGEMKLQLQPEGLGQVNLKVLVQDGQVNVQMMAENDSAKKLLENGLNELKAQLAAHKLHVETLKVDMQADAGLKKFEQNLGDAQREQARQFASDFMGQFRDERQGFFSSYMDRSNMKGYARPQKRASVEPAPADGVQPSASRRGESAGHARRLNLVA